MADENPRSPLQPRATQSASSTPRRRKRGKRKPHRSKKDATTSLPTSPTSTPSQSKSTPVFHLLSTASDDDTASESMGPSPLVGPMSTPTSPTAAASFHAGPSSQDEKLESVPEAVIVEKVTTVDGSRPQSEVITPTAEAAERATCNDDGSLPRESAPTVEPADEGGPSNAGEEVPCVTEEGHENPSLFGDLNDFFSSPELVAMDAPTKEKVKKQKKQKSKGSSGGVIEMTDITNIPGVKDLGDEDYTSEDSDKPKPRKQAKESPYRNSRPLSEKDALSIRKASFSMGSGSSMKLATDPDLDYGPDYRIDAPDVSNGQNHTLAALKSSAQMLQERIPKHGGKHFEERIYMLKVSDCTIKKAVTFDHCHLDKPCFTSIVFSEVITFRNCVIEAPVFQNCTFRKGIRFVHCALSVTKGVRSNFDRILSQETFQLRNCVVEGRLGVSNCCFWKPLDCWETCFRGWVQLTQSDWEVDLDLRACTFFDGLVLTKCNVKGNLLLRGAVVNKKLSLEETCLHGCLDLQKSKLNDFTYLESVDFEPSSSIRLKNCIPRFVLIKPNQLDDRLAAEREKDFATAAEEYGILKNNYHALNWMDAEDWAYYRFKVSSRRAVRRNCRGRSWRITRDFNSLAEVVLMDWSCGYGTMPLRVLKFSGVIIFLFAVMICIPPLLHGWNDYDQDITNSVRLYHITGDRLTDTILTSLTASAAVYTSGFDAVDKNVEGWLAIAFAIESMLGYVFFGLFIVSFSRKVVR